MYYHYGKWIKVVLFSEESFGRTLHTSAQSSCCYDANIHGTAIWGFPSSSQPLPQVTSVCVCDSALCMHADVSVHADVCMLPMSAEIVLRIIHSLMCLMKIHFLLRELHPSLPYEPRVQTLPSKWCPSPHRNPSSQVRVVRACSWTSL